MSLVPQEKVALLVFLLAVVALYGAEVLVLLRAMLAIARHRAINAQRKRRLARAPLDESIASTSSGAPELLEEDVERAEVRRALRTAP